MAAERARPTTAETARPATAGPLITRQHDTSNVRPSSALARNINNLHSLLTDSEDNLASRTKFYPQPRPRAFVLRGVPTGVDIGIYTPLKKKQISSYAPVCPWPVL